MALVSALVEIKGIDDKSSPEKRKGSKQSKSTRKCKVFPTKAKGRIKKYDHIESDEKLENEEMEIEAVVGEVEDGTYDQEQVVVSIDPSSRRVGRMTRSTAVDGRSAGHTKDLSENDKVRKEGDSCKKSTIRNKGKSSTKEILIEPNPNTVVSNKGRVAKFEEATTCQRASNKVSRMGKKNTSSSSNPEVKPEPESDVEPELEPESEPTRKLDSRVARVAVRGAKLKKSPTSSSNIGKVRIIFSMIQPDEEEIAQAKKIGAEIVTSPALATHAITLDELTRTPKLIASINYGLRYILRAKWLTDSATNGAPIDLESKTNYQKYAIFDRSKERQWGFSLQKTLAIPNRGTLFANIVFYVAYSSKVYGMKCPPKEVSVLQNVYDFETHRICIHSY